MSVELVRIDDRLVHGQVVEGWLKAQKITHIVVASDTVAGDETQKALYFLAIPHGTELECLSLADAAAAWHSKTWQKGRVMVLASGPQEVLTLVQKGAEITSINVGGMHYKEGRIQVLKAVSLNDQDVAVFKTLAAKKIILEARPLPLDEPIDLKPYLDRWDQDRQMRQEQPR